MAFTTESEEIDPIEILSGFRRRLNHDPFRQVIDELEFPQESAPKPYLQDRQFQPLEGAFRLMGCEQSVPHDELEAKSAGWRPIYHPQLGMIGRAEIQTGLVNLHIDRDGTNPQVVLAQYAHNSREEVVNGNTENYNDGIVNVLAEPNGTIYSMMMTADGDYTLSSFVPNFGENSGLSYPEDERDALAIVKKNTPRNPNFFPLMGKAAILTTLACDTYRGRERDYTQAEKNLFLTDSGVREYNFNREGLTPELAAFLGTETTTHPLSGLVDENLIPENSKVFVVENYSGLISNLAQGGYPFPQVFRSHETGMYVSRNAVWDQPDATYGFEEFLGSQEFGLGENGRATILPANRPEGYYQEEWQTPLKVVAHNLLLQVFQETLDDEKKNELIEFCNQNVRQAKHLTNHAVGLRTEIPDQGDNKSPYSFNKYSRPKQEKMLAGFISGIMTANRDMLRYWSAKPLWGEDNDDSTRWQWAPQGIKEVMDSMGFRTDNLPITKIYPPFVREVRNGIEERADRPYANPDLSL